MMDWIAALQGFSQSQINAACQAYLKTGPSRRPAPRDIRERIESGRSEPVGQGSRASLTHDERFLLETQILPTARRWLTIPGLKDHGKATLAYWGEKE